MHASVIIQGAGGLSDSAVCLSFALRGMEEEDIPAYTTADLKAASVIRVGRLRGDGQCLSCDWVSGQEAIRALERLGFVQVRQQGSHVVLTIVKTPPLAKTGDYRNRLRSWLGRRLTSPYDNDMLDPTLLNVV